MQSDALSPFVEVLALVPGVPSSQLAQNFLHRSLRILGNDACSTGGVAGGFPGHRTGTVSQNVTTDGILMGILGS